MFENMIGPGLGMGLLDAILTQPDHLRLWVAWLVVINLAVPLIFIQRAEAWATVVVFVLSAGLMSWLFEAYGFSKLLGLAHLVFWPPLLWWLWTRWYGIDSMALRLWILALAASNSASLVIDAVNLVRYILNH